MTNHELLLIWETLKSIQRSYNNPAQDGLMIDLSHYLKLIDDQYSQEIHDAYMYFIKMEATHRAQEKTALDAFILLLQEKAQGDRLPVEQAKRYPLSSLVEFNAHGMAKCPFHNENTASFKYYPQTNTAYCFGCSESCDSIKLYKHLHGGSFASVVRILGS